MKKQQPHDLAIAKYVAAQANSRCLRSARTDTAMYRARLQMRLPAVPIINSALLYASAFSVIFFVQELFLVLPKALTPGLYPTLLHNNHNWHGENPLARLFQGTGALATVISALLCAVWLSRRPPRSATLQLFLIWLIYHGCFEALPQVIIGAFLPQNDVGMAMNYLQLSATTKYVAATLAFIAIVTIAISLTKPLLALAQSPAEIDTPGKRMGFIFFIATLPAFIGTLLIFPHRVPGAIDQVYIVPIGVMVIGMFWIQASAWRVTTARAGELAPMRSIAYPLAAWVILLLIFQLILRPGIPFY
jgi:hypothetical protein